MITDWRLSPETIAFIKKNSDELYLSAPEKKKYISSTIKKISDYTISGYKQIALNDPQFEVKISNTYKSNAGYFDNRNLSTTCIDQFDSLGVVFVKSSSLPDTEKWYRLCNSCSKNVWSIIKNNEVNHGLVTGTFETAFSDCHLGEVMLINNSTPEYSNCFSELERRLNFSFGTKTKKWKPGYKYSTLDDTFYYLCPVLSRKTSNNKGDFIQSDFDLVPSFLYVSKINDTDKNVSDILNNRPFGVGEYDIKIGKSFPSAVDLGEQLKNDFNGDIQNYWSVLIDNTEKSAELSKKINCSSYSFELPSFSYPGNILDIISVQSESNLVYNEDLVSKKIIPILKKTLNNIFFNYWDRTIEKNTQTETIFSYLYSSFSCIGDLTIKDSYYKDLFNYVKIDINSIIENFKSNEWNVDVLSKDLPSYLKNIDYFTDRSVGSIRIVERVKTSTYTNGNTTIGSKLSSFPYLKNSLIGLANYIISNDGVGSTMYNVYNIGTKKSPREYIQIYISIKDLISYFNGVDKITPELAKDILNYKFTFLSLEIDNGSDVL